MFYEIKKINKEIMKVSKELETIEFTANIEFAFEDGQYILDDQDFDLLEARCWFTKMYIVRFQREKWNQLIQNIFDNQQELFAEEFKKMEDDEIWSHKIDQGESKFLDLI